MNYRIFLLPVFFSFIGAVSQNSITTKEVLALTEIESPSFTISFEYNQYGWVASETKVGIGNENLSYKFEYEYDEYGNITLLTKNDPNLTRKEENEYNTANQIVLKKIHEDYGTGFKFYEQYLYTYQDARLQTALRQIISPNGPVNCTKQEFTYNKDSQLEHIAKSDWVISDWLLTEIIDVEYNEWGDILYYSIEMLQSGDQFVKMERYCFIYDDDNALTERAYHNGLGSGWNPRATNRYLYYYETLKEEEEIVFPNIYQFDELNFNWFASEKKLVKDGYWLADCGGVIHFVESANYSYRTITINIEEGIEDKMNSNVLVYPNPTTGALRISPAGGGLRGWNNGELRIENVEIFDIYGRKLSSNHLITSSPHHLINISHLNAGIYFVKIQTEKGIVTKKIVKQ